MDSHETFTYTYNLSAGDTPVQIIILVESEPDTPNHYTFSLSMKVGHAERAVSMPVIMKLSIDPRRLEFAVFAFPPRSSLPTGCLYNLRVWLRTAGADHRLFAEKDLWFGRDPDFRAIANASFAVLRNATQDMSIYQGIVGRAHVSFIFRWTLVEPGTYALSLDYEAGGAGRTLFENYQLRLYCEPQSVSFVIYSIPISSTPAGASHRLRVWIRTPDSPGSSYSHSHSHSYPNAHSHPRIHALARSLSSRSHPFLSPPSAPPPITTESYVYQRLWKTDTFKVGAHLTFDVLPKVVVATPVRTPDALMLTCTPNQRRMSRLTSPVMLDTLGDVGEAVDDC